MADIHDDRRIPLDYQPGVSASQRSHWQTFLDLFRRRRNAQDDRRAQAVERNHADRQADALRQLRQPGLTPEQRDLAMRVLGRVGSGGGK